MASNFSSQLDGHAMELIVSHSHTDFDGLAAQLAAQKLYPRALPLLNPRVNDNVAEFEALYHEQLPFLTEDDLPEEPVTRLIVVDMPSPPNLRGLTDERIPTIIIDHHPREREPQPHEELIHAEVGAVTSLLVERLMASQIALSATEATLMLLGIYEDTGRLSFSSTRQADVAAAAWLLGQGARIEALGEFLRRPLTPEQEQLFHQLDANTKMLEIGGWTVLLTSADVEGDVPQLSTLAEKLRDLYTPAVTALAISTGRSGTQIILRANSDALDAGAVARGFGGGGHRAAAAAYVRERRADDVLHDLEAAIRRQMRRSPMAIDIMTRHVRTAPLDATIKQANDLLARYGHSALPVVDEQRVVHGLVTRRDLSRATRHGRDDAKMSRYMWGDPPLIGPETPLSAMRQAIADEGGERGGRLLVVDNQQRLLGIVTRADLLQLTDAPNDDTEESLADELEQFLDPALLDLLQRAAAIAEENGWALYVVGGTVRDLLLRRPQGDLDLVVEGDAIGLAEALAAAIGGTVRSHAQFRTATLELEPAQSQEQTPESDQEQHSTLTLDFVTARTEFYEYPSALPSVEAASLRHDLHRRDFTINTMAICLNPSRYGRLYDFYGGQRDLDRGLIRVLHNLSFIDDPTRILRAARLTARLDFMLEARTRDLIDDAMEYAMFGRTSPQRLINEFRLTLHEECPEQVIALLDEWGALHGLHPALRWTHNLGTQFKTARRTRFQDAPLTDIYLGLLVFPLTDDDREGLIERYLPSGEHARLIRDISLLCQRIPKIIEPNIRDSLIDQLLHALNPSALRAGQLAEPHTAHAIDRYLTVLRHIKPELNGNDLRRLGLTPGPRLGKLLAELRAAKLDGLAPTRSDEEAWVQKAIAALQDANQSEPE